MADLGAQRSASAGGFRTADRDHRCDDRSGAEEDPGSGLSVAVDERAGPQVSVFADDTVMGHHGINVEVYVRTEGDVGVHPSTGREQYSLADVIV